MNTTALSRSEVREVDRQAIEELKMPGLVLMENAGRGCVDVLQSLGVRGPVLLACGKGNNGGDGFVIARHLDNAGISVHVALLCAADELQGDAAANYEWLQETAVERFTIDAPDFQENLRDVASRCEWVIDALLGTGATGSPRSPYAEVISHLNEIPARRLAVDLPSGLDCDTGQAGKPTFKADRTCTFVAIKPGLMADEARSFVGIIHVVDIGVPGRLISRRGPTKK